MAAENTDAMVAERMDAREKLAKAFQPGSPIGAVFVGAQADAAGNTPVLFVNASGDVPEIITYSVGTAAMYGDVAEMVAEDAHVDLSHLDQDSFCAVAARSVGAAGCSSVRIPGVQARSISTRPPLEACKIFAAENRVAKIETVSLARSRKLAWKINKFINPNPRSRSKKQNVTEATEDGPDFAAWEEEWEQIDYQEDVPLDDNAETLF